MLRRVGFNVHPIFEVYPNNAHENISDPEWIKLCGQNNWVVITGDKRIEVVPENRQAVIDAKAKVFLLTDSNSHPEEWAAAVIVGHYKIKEIIEAHSGPFFVNVGKRSDSHLRGFRLPPGYVSSESSTQQRPSEIVSITPTPPVTTTASEEEKVAADDTSRPAKPSRLFD